ncbi:carbohydrate kinase family protein [Mongoliimonas terrestris]|uniref:carbohydrate kinase family protein n=1 Tax=Mongoliimonas terrestris TaxID=1709001 RepID=UPI00094977B5|nr:PfkB family carbohydrate kinase [Mongoliimonas terrestris]
MRPLAVVGNVNVDLIVGPVAPWPRTGTEILVPDDDLRVGGAAGNTSLAWRALGVDHQIAATVGDDAFGAWLKAGFGPLAARWRMEPGPTTLSVGITHPDGERTFLTTRGHLPAMDWPGVAAMLDGERLAGGILLLCGSFLTDRLAADYPALFDWAEARGIAVALDTGWPLADWTDMVRAEVRGWLARSTFCLLNEVETAALAGIDDVAEAAGALRALMPPGAIVVTKRGPNGAIGVGPDRVTVQVPAPPVAVVDTIGAGDVFNAGFLAALAEGRDLEAALAHGVATASAAVSSRPRRAGKDDRPQAPSTSSA